MSDTELTICQMVYDQAAATPPTPVMAAEMPRPVTPAPAQTMPQRPAPTPMPPPPPPVVQRPAPPPPPPPAPMPTPRPQPMTPIPRPMAPNVIAPAIQAQPAPTVMQQPVPMVMQQPTPVVVQVPPPPMPRPMPPRPVPRVMMLEAEMEMEMTVEQTRHTPMVHTMPAEQPVVLPAEAPHTTFPAMECPMPMPAPCAQPMECAMPCEMPVVQAACAVPTPCVQAAMQTTRMLPTLTTELAPPSGSCLALPYPTVRNIEKNDRYAKIILNLYAGRVSELSAVMTYFYDYITFGCQCPEAYDVLEGIAVCEMHHMEILGKLLCALGTPPKLYGIENGSPRWWSGNPCCMTYASSLGIAILNAIEDEKKAIRSYSDAICQIDNDQIALLLRRIIMDEEHHIRLLTSLYERCVH